MTQVGIALLGFLLVIVAFVAIADFTPIGFIVGMTLWALAVYVSYCFLTTL